ncbi:iron-siderophore ABC transporter substrate-binding protein [Agromyces sp. H3Y2-19a]|uniref:iron-siderophore ABC transporter substrate-binding protein n=1 Tax=Agromyces chromiiresistens TaxID=3030835 RepID=UPI0023B995B7|nr:iron-siderophore ABC transporter substrate-binding protein [Agromyces chromiiresistens]MDF0514742.1 iron-siderophore ABC transporter substrate-binding protein [Agromyces chromiiresistens]
MRTPAIALSAVAAASLLLLTGCGTTEAPEAATDADAAITVTDDRGEEITLDAPAEKVVALEWNTAENLVALGVMPAGVADVAGYTAWVQSEPLDEGVTDVGMRGEPSVDAIAGLAPDLVVTTTDLPETVIAQVEEFAPVLVVRGADASNPIGQMESNLERIATATGTEEAGEALLDGFHAKIDEGKAAIEEAGLAGTPFMMSDSWASGGQVSIRPFTEGALLTAVTEELGLENAWTGEGDADYGLGSTDVEGLTGLGDLQFLYITNGEADAYAVDLADNAVWKSLPFVQSGNVHRLPDGIWMFGGPSSMNDYIDAVVDTLAG